MIIPLVIFYFFGLTNLLYYSNKHGKPRDGEYNFWIGLISTIINLVLVWWLIGWRFW